MKKTMMNYEAPVAEMIEMQASMVLMGSGGGAPTDPSDPGDPDPSDPTVEPSGGGNNPFS